MSDTSTRLVDAACTAIIGELARNLLVGPVRQDAKAATVAVLCELERSFEKFAEECAGTGAEIGYVFAASWCANWANDIEAVHVEG